MFEELKEKYENLDNNFSKGIKSKISETSTSFFDKGENDFLMKLKDLSTILFNGIDKAHSGNDKENQEIRYKLKIDALTKLNKLLIKFPTLKAKEKLNAFKIIKVIGKDLKKLKADIITGNKAILPDEFLKDADFPGVDHTSDKIEDADTWSFEKLVKETKAINIESDNISNKDWDSYIDDLRNGPASKIQGFENKIIEFKKSKVYIESKSYNPLSEVGADVNGLNIKSIGIKIDDTINDILEKIKDDKKVGKISLNIEGIELEFNSKEEALRTFYKIKLVLSELSKEDVGILTVLGNVTSIDYYASEVVDGISGGIGTIPLIGGLLAVLLTIVGYAGIGYLNIKPIGNSLRHTKDIITLLGGKTLREWRDKDTFLGRWAKRFSYNYIDPVSSETKISVFDFNESAGDLEEQDTRRKILELAKRVSKGNKTAEKQLADLTTMFHKSILSPIGSDISVESESYWRKIYAIVNEHNIGQRMATGFSASSYKQKVIDWQTETLKDQKESAKLIFDGLGPENLEKTIDELKFTSDFENLVHNIDLGDGLSGNDYVSSSEETLRTNNIKELIRKVKDLEIFITPEALRGEILKTIKGYYPNSLAVEKIREEFKTKLNKDITLDKDQYKEIQNIKKFLRSVKEGKWLGTEIELNQAITEIRSGMDYTNVTGYNINANDDYIGTKLEKEYKDLIKQGEKLSKEDYKTMSGFKIDRSLEMNEGYENFKDSLKADLETKKLLEDIKGNTINISDIETELEKLFKEGIINDKLDWTSKNFNFIIREVFNGKSYLDAVSSIDISTNRTIINSGNYNKKSLQNIDIKGFQTEFRAKLTELDNSATTLERKEKIVKDLDKYLKSIENNGLSDDFEKQNFGKETKDFKKLKNKLGLNLDEAFARLDSSNEFKGKSKEIIDNSKSIFKDLQKTSLFDTFEANLKEYLIDNKQLKNSKLKNIINGVLSGGITETDLEDFKNVVDNKSNSTYKINIDSIKKEELKINILSDGEISTNTTEYHVDENFILKTIVSSWNQDVNTIKKLDKDIKTLKNLNSRITDLNRLDTRETELGNVEGDKTKELELQSIKKKIEKAGDDIRDLKNKLNIDSTEQNDTLFAKQKAILEKFKTNNLFKTYLKEQGINKFNFEHVKTFMKELSNGEIDKNLLLKINNTSPTVDFIEPDKIRIPEPETFEPKTQENTSTPETTKEETTKEETKASPETDYDRMNDKEKTKKIDKFSEIYDRAILQAQINGNYDLADDLFNEKINPNLSDKDIINKVGTLESNIKRIIGTDKLKSLDKLKLEYTKLEVYYKNILLNKGILKINSNGKYITKTVSNLDTKLNSISNPSIISYFKKAFKSGS